MKVAMVKHKPYGKVFWFEIPEYLVGKLQPGFRVACNTARGRRYGTVVAADLDEQDVKEVMLWSQRGINWNDFPTELKRGSCCIKRQFEETIDDPRNPGQKITVCRNRWIIDHEIPIFTQDRNYIERLI